MPETSTKPYLLRALYEWCTDNGYTPYIVVVVDAGTRVPAEFVKNGEIVLNISFEATGNLKIDNDFIHFKARFGGVAREIEVPVSNVSAIYARENGQGMAFEVQREEEGQRKKKPRSEPTKTPAKTPAKKISPLLSAVPPASPDPDKVPDDDNQPDPPGKGGRPRLTRIK
jgi:stringent starvation protein B